MNTLLKIAWRNLWRSKRRTLILFSAMTAGLVGVLFSMGLTNSWLVQIKDNMVRMFQGHIKIHGTGFHDHPVVERCMPTLGNEIDAIRRDPRVKAVAERIVLQGLLSTAAQSRVITIIGINPVEEGGVSILPSSVTEGVYFTEWEGASNPALIGRRLADRLERMVGKKIVLMAQQSGNNEVGSGAFRIAGIYDTGNGGFDQEYVYIRAQDAQEMMNLGSMVTEAVVMLHDIDESDAVTKTLANQFRDIPVDVLSWKERMPLMEKTIEMSRQMMIPYYVIFYLAMAFGIVNTLLMTIGERTHEIGVMMAIGLRRRAMVSLIVLESSLIACIAMSAGTIAGWGIVAWFGKRGINLSGLAEGLAYMGVNRVIYPGLSVANVVCASLGGLTVAIIFALYPAWRASRLAPADVIGKI